MYRLYSILLMAVLCNACQSTVEKIVWQDEFDYTGLPDSTKWSYDVGAHGWGNNELQLYTKADSMNVQVKDGFLHITARYDSSNHPSFTSARLTSKKKGDWKYGKIEVRAKLPTGRGIWPAIWMLPTDWVYGGWPHSGEIDIMEYVGFEKDSLFGTVHTGAYNHVMQTHKGEDIYLPNVADTFRVYQLKWSEKMIQIGVDNHYFFEFANEHDGSAAWPFDQAFHLLLNVAVGGNWGGKHGVDTSIFPQTLVIDYVRIYQ
jgi:beta-glucanase (GH16 family)